MNDEIKAPQTIIGLTVENVKKIKLVQLSPDGKTILITGGNEQGKTSLVDAIWWNLEGKNAMRKTSEPIREGEAEAKTITEFQDFIVERKITRKDSYLRVTLKDEAQTKITSPQKFLDSFLSTISIDPTEILRMSPKDQVDTLLRLFGIYDQVTDLDKKYTEAYNLRWAKGQERDSAVGALENMEAPADNIPLEETSIADLSKKLTDAINFNNYLNEAGRKLQENKDYVQNTKASVINWEDQIKLIQDKIDKAKEYITTTEEKITKDEQYLAPLVSQDTAPIETEIAQVENSNAHVRAAKTYRDFQVKVDNFQTIYRDLNAVCEGILEEKMKIIQGVPMPVEGLSIDDRGLVFGPTKRPMAQLSDSEKLKIAAAIAMAEKPTIRLLRITHGESLDDDSMNMLIKMAYDNGYQPIVEKVDTSGKLGIVLEEGEVVATNSQLTHSETKETS